MIGMHGGLPPSNTFPFTWFQSGLLPLPSDTTTGFAADNTSTASAHATVMKVDDPQLVSAAQQYNMHAQVRLPYGSSCICLGRSTASWVAGWGVAIELIFQAVQGTRPSCLVLTEAESANACKQSIVLTIRRCGTPYIISHLILFN